MSQNVLSKHDLLLQNSLLYAKVTGVKSCVTNGMVLISLQVNLFPPFVDNTYKFHSEEIYSPFSILLYINIRDVIFSSPYFNSSIFMFLGAGSLLNVL